MDRDSGSNTEIIAKKNGWCIMRWKRDGFRLRDGPLRSFIKVHLRMLTIKSLSVIMKDTSLFIIEEQMPSDRCSSLRR